MLGKPWLLASTSSEQPPILFGYGIRYSHPTGVTAILHPDHENFNETEYASKGATCWGWVSHICVHGYIKLDTLW